MHHLRIGINNSRVSLFAAQRIREQLEAAHDGLKVEFETYETALGPTPGDPEAHVRALEEPLEKGRVDVIVHQLKEIPVRLPAQIRLVGVTERLTPCDAFVSERYQLIDELPEGARLGYTHLRQRAQLQIQLRHLQLELIQVLGSAEERLRQLGEQNLDGLIISADSLELVGRQESVSEVLGESMLLPRPGAGCLGFITRREDPEIEELLKPVEDRTSRLETMAERAFLDTLGGDPELALGARAALDSQSMIVEGILSNTDGTVYIRDAIQGPSHLAEELGRNLAKLLLALGDEELHGLIPAPSQ